MIISSDIIKEYCITEKASDLAANQNKYTFEVHLNANRIQVTKAVEQAFDVRVTRVNILNKVGKLKPSRGQRGKFGRTPAVKRAIVTLKAGDAIELV